MEESSPLFGSSASAPQMRFGKIDDLGSRVAVAVDAARKYLFSQQHEEGYWCGELEADTTLESDYILLHTLLGTGNQERFDKAARYILNHQNEDGGWSIYAAGPSNISASVKAYFGLKLAGFTADHPALARARKKILEMGGVTEVNTFTKIYLCFFGQYDYDAVPGDSAGDRAVSELVLVQYLRNFFVVARHSGAAFDLLREEAVQEDSRRNGSGGAFRRRARQVAHAPALGEEAGFRGAISFWCWIGSRIGRSGCTSVRCVRLRSEEGREVDAGALRNERRPGGDLSLDDERDHRAALPGVFGGRSAVYSRDGRV